MEIEYSTSKNHAVRRYLLQKSFVKALKQMRIIYWMLKTIKKIKLQRLLLILVPSKIFLYVGFFPAFLFRRVLNGDLRSAHFQIIHCVYFRLIDSSPSKTTLMNVVSMRLFLFVACSQLRVQEFGRRFLFILVMLWSKLNILNNGGRSQGTKMDEKNGKSRVGKQMRHSILSRRFLD
ncbi:hypothetical protein ACO02O_03146 [Dirofilaria immitis]